MRAWIALVVVAVALAGCGEEPADSVAATRPSTSTTTTTAPAPALPTELTVECTATDTSVSPGRVAAQPDGLHVTVVNNTKRSLSAIFENPAAPRRWRHAYVSPGQPPVAIAPGTVHIRCVDMDQPEHSESVIGKAETKMVQVEADEDSWTPPVEITECSGPMSGLVSDFAAEEGTFRDPTGPPEEAVRRDSHLSSAIRPDDELRRLGYRQPKRATVAVIRRGRAVAIADVFAHSGRWAVGSVDACDSEFRSKE